MKSFCSKLALFFMALLIVLCHSCDTTKQPAVEVPAEPSDIVAKIGDYLITRQMLERRLMTELSPDEEAIRQRGPVDAETVLRKMIAEKAMIIDAREKNYLQDDRLSALIKQFKEEKLINVLLGTHLRGKAVTVTKSEVEEKMKADPRLNRKRAAATLRREKVNKLIDQLYSELYKKFHVQKLRDNFPKAISIHRRLLFNAKDHLIMKFIRFEQVRNELTPQEKNIVLAKYDNGKVTLENWFDVLVDFSPPSRPKDLNTVEGVERLLDGVMRTSIFVSEAGARGLDRDKDFLKQVREREDRLLFSRIRREKLKDIKELTAEQTLAYFNKNKEGFAIAEMLGIAQIWCQDLKTARKARAELDGGADFESVGEKYSLEKKVRTINTYPIHEGMFFEDLWKGELNEVVGPVKGFYRPGIKWRVVKILEKKPRRLREYSSDVEDDVKISMWQEQRDAIMAEYRKELLEKYPHEIYAERITDIDPLDIP